MALETDDFSEENTPGFLIRTAKTAFNAVFMTLCRPFSSREVSVSRNFKWKQREYYKYDQVGSGGLSLLTANFLRGNLLRNLHEATPQYFLDIIDDFFRLSKDHTYLLIAADLCRYFAERADNEEAVKHYLSAFRFCYLIFSMKNKAGQQDETFENSLLLQALQILNESIAGIFTYLKGKKLLDCDTFTLQGVDGCEFVLEKPSFLLSVPRSAVSDFSLCSDYNVKALRLINRHSGIGVPLVADVDAQNLSQSLRTPPGLTIPVTIFFQVKLHSEKRFSLCPVYQDTSMREVFEFKGNCPGSCRLVLARDFTTPLACFMSGITRRNLISGMLHPVTYAHVSGLYMVEPYRPEKIPVVFIHGLMSSPETWGPLINSLKYDPKVRQKYQFWFFSYSTGTPVTFSAQQLRQALMNAHQEFCTSPEATENFEKMVLVGHSMGGLIVRLLLLQNPYQALEHFSGKSYQECCRKLSPADQQLLEASIVFKPLSFVRRAVFMAVPHRGAAMAQKGLAHLGIRLIRLPQYILSRTSDFQRIMKIIMPEIKVSWRTDSFITGIDNLKPDSLFVQWAGDAPLKENVAYHSIIGNRKAAATPGGSDGVVPYQSSHLNGVASECIVQSDHSVHRKPAAIRELMRILLLHLEENANTEPSGVK